MPASGRLKIIRFYDMVILISFFFICLIPAPASSALAKIEDLDLTEAPWHISAQTITHNRETNLYTATGNVIIQKDDKTISCDKIEFNHNTMQALSEGNVNLKVGNDILVGDRVFINLETGTGTIYNGRLFIEKRHFYIRGDEIRKTGETSYKINKGSITSCDGETPAWKITGKDLDLTIEKYGTVNHAALWIKKMPMIYVPYFVFPVKLKRQSGLLLPQIGYSDRNGIEFIQPLFLVFNRSSDATLYYHHLQDRGEKIGCEFRYMLSDYSRGTLKFDTLNDRKTDDGETNSNEMWGYTDDDVLRLNSDRYWFRMKLNQMLPFAFKSHLDIDVISDQDYLREFSDGYTGYDDTKKYFLSEFGRDIDDDDDPVRKNSLLLSKQWIKHSFNAELLWYDNVISRRQQNTDDFLHEQDTDDKLLQQLPVILFNSLKQPILTSPIFMSMESQYANFYRKDGLTGDRMDVHPRVYVPYQYKNYFMIEPSIGFHQTLWYLDREKTEFDNQNKYEYQHRELYDIKTDLSTELENIFDFHAATFNKVKHTFIPKIEYSFIPESDQSKHPDFDSLDQIDNENLITFSITNIVTSKKKQTSPVKTVKSDGIRNFDYIYNQFCRFLIEQSYDFNLRNKQGEEPFYPLTAKLDLMPNNYFKLRAEAEWSHEQNAFTSHNQFVKISDIRKDYLLIEHRYSRDANHSLYFAFNAVISDAFSVTGSYSRNIKDDKDIRKKIGGLFLSQCWSLEVSFEDEKNDQKSAVMINLYGLGEIGNRL